MRHPNFREELPQQKLARSSFLLHQKTRVSKMSGKRLEGKVAIITGGAAGIGEATARQFIAHGAKILIIDIQDSLGLSVADSLGPDALYVHCDVTIESEVSNAVNLAISTFGKLDIMFNNAGVLDPFRPHIDDVETAEFERVLAVNVTGVFLGTKHAARVMGPGGSIINHGSVASVIGGVASHAYVASKHAVVGLTKNAAAELGQKGIRVNCVSPFAVESSLTTGFAGAEPGEVDGLVGGASILKGFSLKVEDITDAIMYFASGESKYVSGHNLVIDGGFTVVKNPFGIFN